MIEAKKVYEVIEGNTLIEKGTKVQADLSGKEIITGKTGMILCALGMGKGSLFIPESNLEAIA